MAPHGSAWAYLLKRRRWREAIADILARCLNGDVREGIAQAPVKKRRGGQRALGERPLEKRRREPVGAMPTVLSECVDPDISPGVHCFEPKECPYYQSSTKSENSSQELAARHDQVDVSQDPRVEQGPVPLAPGDIDTVPSGK